MEASERGVRKSNEEIKRTTLGLLGVLSLFVIIYTFNKGLLSGDVGLEKLRTRSASSVSVGTGSTGSTGGTNTDSSNTSPRSCESSQGTINALSSGNVCSGAICTALSGCSYTTYLPTIQAEAARAGVDYKVVVALMCKESKAKADAQNRNPNGTYDCGLMQVNQATPCDASSLDPATNIAKGVNLLKQKMSAASQVYQSVPPLANVFASYNCCANGTIPAAPSADCTQQAGFPFSVPKWVCPINPGDGQFNMCVVKNYACELTACVNQL